MKLYKDLVVIIDLVPKNQLVFRANLSYILKACFLPNADGIIHDQMPIHRNGSQNVECNQALHIIFGFFFWHNFSFLRKFGNQITDGFY